MYQSRAPGEAEEMDTITSQASWLPVKESTEVGLRDQDPKSLGGRESTTEETLEGS